MRRDLARLQAREHDVLVIGGGIHGAAAAREAVRRGLAVALLEAADFGSGASWNSLKTIHGGLRHLQRADVPGLRESWRERRALMALAPEIVRPLAFLVPVYGHGPRGREALAVGLRAFDLLTRDLGRGLPPERRLPSSRMLGPAEVRARLPLLPARGLTGGALWYDAQVASSERLLVGLLRAAADEGAQLANYAPVTGLLREGSRVRGARAVDAETGQPFEVHARAVVSAAGAGYAALVRMAGIAREEPPLVEAMNLVLSRPVVREAAVGARAEGRFLFLVPWRDRAIVGTEYSDPQTAIGGRAAAFLELARRAFPWADLRDGDVSLVHRGMVPGRSGTRLMTRHRIVDHEREDGTSGFISILSVKYTTARAAAEEAVDLALRRLGGAAERGRAEGSGLPWARLLDGPLEARARQAARDEMALHVGDAVLRRLDLGTAGPPPLDEVETVAASLAAELGWSADRRASETRAFWDEMGDSAPAAFAGPGPARITTPSRR
jgi:glycerol-3-phosphate dehydrogenase